MDERDAAIMCARKVLTRKPMVHRDYQWLFDLRDSQLKKFIVDVAKVEFGDDDHLKIVVSEWRNSVGAIAS